MIHLHNIQLNSQFSFNLLLHLTILYTILASLFMYYISNVASDTINNEINSIIENIIKNIKLDQHNIKNKILENLNDNELRNKIQNSCLFTLVKDDNMMKILNEKLSNHESVKLLNNIKQLNKDKNDYEYWLNLFKKDDPTRNKNNNQVFFYIKFINVLLIAFLLFFAYFIYVNKTIKVNDFKVIITENILTFIGVGIIEYLFFTNVALKYIPAPPSLLYESFMNSLKKNLEQYI